jgi:hypothetical protein
MCSLHHLQWSNTLNRKIFKHYEQLCPWHQFWQFLCHSVQKLSSCCPYNSWKFFIQPPYALHIWIILNMHIPFVISAEMVYRLGMIPGPTRHTFSCVFYLGIFTWNIQEHSYTKCQWTKNPTENQPEIKATNCRHSQPLLFKVKAGWKECNNPWLFNLLQWEKLYMWT